MGDNVVPFPINLVTEEPEITADEVLEHCMGGFKQLVVIGIENDGSRTFTTNVANPLEVFDMMSDAAASFAREQLALAFYDGTEH